MCDIRGWDTEGDPPILNPLSLLLEVAGAPRTPALTGVLGLATQSSPRVPRPPTAGPPGLRIPGFFNIPGSSWPSFSPALFAGSRRRWGGGRLFGPDGRALPWAPHLEHWLEAETCGAVGTTEGCASGHFVLPHVCPARVGSLWGHSEPRTPLLLLRSTVTQVEVRLWTRKNIRGDLGRCRARSVWAR